MFCRGCSGRPKTPTQIPRRVFYQFPTDRRCWATLPFTVKVALRRQGTYFCGILRREADAWAWPVRLVPLDSHNVPRAGVVRGRWSMGGVTCYSQQWGGRREASVFNLPGGETFGITSSAEKNLKWEAYYFPVLCLPLSTGRKRPPGRWVPEVPVRCRSTGRRPRRATNGCSEVV